MDLLISYKINARLNAVLHSSGTLSKSGFLFSKPSSIGLGAKIPEGPGGTYLSQAESDNLVLYNILPAKIECQPFESSYQID